MNTAETRSAKKAGASASKQHSGQTIKTPSKKLLSLENRERVWRCSFTRGEPHEPQPHTSWPTPSPRPGEPSENSQLTLPAPSAPAVVGEAICFWRSLGAQQVEGWKGKRCSQVGATNCVEFRQHDKRKLACAEVVAREDRGEQRVSQFACWPMGQRRCVLNGPHLGTFEKPSFSCNCLQQVLSTWPELCPAVAENTDMCRRVRILWETICISVQALVRIVEQK